MKTIRLLRTNGHGHGFLECIQWCLSSYEKNDEVMFDVSEIYQSITIGNS